MLSSDPFRKAHKVIPADQSQIVASDTALDKSTTWLKKALAAKSATFDRILDGSIVISDLVAKSLRENISPANHLIDSLSERFSDLNSDEKNILAELCDKWTQAQSDQALATYLSWQVSITTEVRVSECSVSSDSIHIATSLPERARGLMVLSDTTRFLTRRPDGKASGYIPRLDPDKAAFSLQLFSCNPDSNTRSQSVLFRIDTQK